MTDTEAQDLESRRDVKSIGREKGWATGLALVLAVQSFCAVFFVVDVAVDFHLVGLDLHHAFEAVVALALIAGVVFGGLEMRRTLERMRRAEAALSLASGAFGQMIDAYFERWGLTPAEREVALLALKGFEVSEIAGLRGAAGGTVRAQLARVYAKAGVSNRTQLVCLFIEDLLDHPLTDGETTQKVDLSAERQSGAVSG